MNPLKTLSSTLCLLFLVVTAVGFITPPAVTHAQAPSDATGIKTEADRARTAFIPLVGIPFVDGGQVKTFGDYVNALYFASISIGAFLAVIKIIFAGVTYMLSDVITDKGQAKKDIRGALLGLLIVVGAVLILNTINPSLKEINLFSDAPVPNILVEGHTNNIYDIYPGDFVKLSAYEAGTIDRKQWAWSCEGNNGSFAMTNNIGVSGETVTGSIMYACNNSDGSPVVAPEPPTDDQGNVIYDIKPGDSVALSIYGQDDDGVNRESWRESCTNNGGTPEENTTSGGGESVNMTLTCIQ